MNIPQKENEYSSLLQKQIDENYWPGYVHAYPHKKAYRNLTENSNELWASIPSKLNIYIHIPFCYRKCGFCNLFTLTINKADESIKNKYVDKVIEQIDYYSSILGHSEVQSIYFGGGTPNTLLAEDIGEIVNDIKSKFPNQAKICEPSIECYPNLLSIEYLETLKNHKIKRISIGIESFKDNDLKQMFRDKSNIFLDELIGNIKELKLNFNIDLIYGLPGHNKDTVKENLMHAISYQPEQISIFPYAYREYTGIGKLQLPTHISMQEKYEMYDISSELLEKSAYICRSYVNWIRSINSSYQQQYFEFIGIPTLGIGAGARSYSYDFHYALPWSILQSETKNIIQYFLSEKPENLRFMGFKMDTKEKKIQFIINRLLADGINCDEFSLIFNENIADFFHEKISALIEQGCIEYKYGVAGQGTKTLLLTKKGRKYSDIVANLFVSDIVRELYKSFKF